MRLGVEAAFVGDRLVPGDVEVTDGVLGRCGVPGEGRGIAVPGFIDLQVNGFAGVDFLDAGSADYEKAGRALLETGVTGYQPTLITAPEEDMVAALAEVPPPQPGLPRVLGVHLEGPFLSSRRPGAHLPRWLRDPDIELLERLLSAGHVRQMTLAPELPGAVALISMLLERGITVSFGHSDATREQANAGFELGVHTVTHLFNAMRPLTHREPGIAGAAIVRDDVTPQIIVDGIHVDPDIVLLVWRATGGQVALVTDAISAAGLGDGTCKVGSVEIEVRDGVARRRDGTLAGSTLTMIDAVRNLHLLGARLEKALAAATTLPASIIGELATGRLAPGLPADIVVLDDNLEIQRVLLGGETRVAA
jgi:N-acetylglucosamine-6-phosphate deacetylase